MSSETTWTPQHSAADTLEILLGDEWETAPEEYFRSWPGKRRKNGVPWLGDVFWPGTDEVKVMGALGAGR